ncbi:MAG TPA: hypothetical protein VGX03_12400 [Candidatus Binatia bacterium]|nr:hypothetical protein [Candidatus Binatia bacterium]
MATTPGYDPAFSARGFHAHAAENRGTRIHWLPIGCGRSESNTEGEAAAVPLTVARRAVPNALGGAGEIAGAPSDLIRNPSN